MIFIDNKYTKTYYKIIERSKNRTVQGYTEKHHIIPKALGGTNLPTNLVILTAREHYICHVLLVKMTTGLNKKKMIYAAAAFMTWTTPSHARIIKMNSRVFQTLKELRQHVLREEMAKPENKKKSSDGSKKLWADPEYKKEASEKRKKLWKDQTYLDKMKRRKRTVKQVIINGILYSSLKDAAEKLNIDPSTVSKRCSSLHIKYANWNYV